MTFLKFKLVCYCENEYTATEMELVDDDMEWVYECPKCKKQVGVQNWTSGSEVQSTSHEEAKPE
jgi:hypothetical protein